MIIFLFGLSFSCSRENGETTYEYHKTVDYYTTFMELLNENDYSSTTGESLDSTNIVKYNKLKIDLNAKTEYVSQVNNFIKLSFCRVRADDLKVITDTIKNISVVTNNKYNSNFSIGDTINDVLQTEYRTLTELNNHHLKSIGTFSFYLSSPPDTTRKCSFTFIVKHTNGNVFKTQTIPITIIP